MTVTLIASIAQDHGPRCGDVTVIAIDGPAGSGKTTLAAELALLTNAQTIHMDDVYNGWEGMREGGNVISRVLAQLERGEVARYQTYNWSLGLHDSWRTVAPEGTLIVEGVGSVRKQHLNLLSAIVMVNERRPQERLRRMVARDGAQVKDHLLAWMREEERLHVETDLVNQAHIIVDGYGRVHS